MKSWRETIRLSQPLRNVVLASVTSQAESMEQRMRVREQAAYERGRLEGERNLGNQLLMQRQEMLALQTGVLQSLRQALTRVHQECEHCLVDLALETARKLVAGLPISREMVEAAIKDTLAQINVASEITVWLHPEDLALLQEANSAASLSHPTGEKLQLAPSNEVTRGGCMVQTHFGTVDARREVRFSLIQNAVTT